MRQRYWWDHDARLISKYVLAIQQLFTTSVIHLSACAPLKDHTIDKILWRCHQLTLNL
jgi:hypothetical protein